MGREFHGPGSSLNCAEHLQEALSPGQKPEQPQGPHSTSSPCRDTQSSCWDKVAQQRLCLCFPAAGRDHPELRLCCGPMARHGGSSTAPQAAQGRRPCSVHQSLALAPRTPSPRAAPLGAGAASAAPQGLRACLPALEQAGLWASLQPQLCLSHSYPALQTGSCTEVVTDPKSVLGPFFGVS